MKILKRITLVLLIVTATIIGIGFILPSDLYVQKKIVINAPVEMVFDQINNLHMWERWSPWHKIDPKMKLQYIGSGIGEGAGYTWQSKHKSVGNGSLTILTAKPYEYINTSMEFDGQNTATANFRFLYQNNQTMLSWDMKANIGNNPLIHWMGLLMRRSVSDAYDRGLSDISDICQTLNEKGWYPVNIKVQPAFEFYGITNKNVTLNSVASVMQDDYSKIYYELAKKNIAPIDAPFALYFSWGETFEMQCGVPVSDNSLLLDQLEAIEVPEQTYAVLQYTGQYSGIENAHQYLIDWLKYTQFELNGAVMEKYKTDPRQEPDSTKWETVILYPVK